MLNVALVEPAAKLMFAGTKAAVPVVQSSTERPPDGAAAVSVTVPVEVWPPVTVAGLTKTVDNATLAEAGVILSIAVWLEPL